MEASSRSYGKNADVGQEQSIRFSCVVLSVGHAGAVVLFCLFGPVSLMMSPHICVPVYKKDKHDPDMDTAPMYILLFPIEPHVQTQLEVGLRNVAFPMVTCVIYSIPVGGENGFGRGIPASFVTNKLMFNVEVGYSRWQVRNTVNLHNHADDWGGGLI